MNEQLTTRRPTVEAIKTQAYRACQHTSFDADKRGEQLMNSLEQELCSFLSQVPNELQEEYEEKYILLYSNWLGAMSRCASTMITGPANFPVRRMEKYNNWERSARTKLNDWSERIIKRLNRTERLTGWAEIERLQSKLEDLESGHERMKAINRITRKKISQELIIEQLVGEGLLTEVMAKEILVPSCFGTVGFEGFTLTNNNAKIKSTKERLERLIKGQNTETKEYEVGDIKVEVNYADNRIRLYFDGKPSAEIRTKLKSNGFKWSPRAGAWQNYINYSSTKFVNEFLHPEAA